MAPSAPPTHPHHGVPPRLAGDGQEIRAVSVIAMSRVTPNEELTITAGSASPKASFRRALLPICTVINVPASSAITKKSQERVLPPPSTSPEF
jgi:hypothetical protein